MLEAMIVVITILASRLGSCGTQRIDGGYPSPPLKAARFRYLPCPTARPQTLGRKTAPATVAVSR